MLNNIFNTVCIWNEVSREIAHTKFNNIPKFIAEHSVSNDSLYIQVDRALDHIAEKSKS